jgi:hypothetical protein
MTPRHRITVRLDDETYQLFAEWAKEDDRSVPYLVAKAATNFVRQRLVAKVAANFVKERKYQIEKTTPPAHRDKKTPSPKGKGEE